MDNWNLIDGYLCLGNSLHQQIDDGTYSRIVQHYNPNYSLSFSDKLKHKLNIELDEKKRYKTGDSVKIKEAFKIATEHFHDYMGYKLKASKDNRYCAVYAENHLHCDFFEQMPPTNWPFNKGKHLFTLKRNTYRMSDIGFIMEFLEHPETKETLFIFNPQHGELSLYNMKGEKVKEGKANDEFFTSLTFINDEYFLLNGWIWQPMSFFSIYNINKFITDPDYCPRWEFEQDGCPMPTVKDGKIVMGAFIFELKFFMNNMNFIVFHFPKIKDNKVLIGDDDFQAEYDLEYFNNHIEECLLDVQKQIDIALDVKNEDNNIQESKLTD